MWTFPHIPWKVCYKTRHGKEFPTWGWICPVGSVSPFDMGTEILRLHQDILQKCMTLNESYSKVLRRGTHSPCLVSSSFRSALSSSFNLYSIILGKTFPATCSNLSVRSPHTDLLALSTSSHFALFFLLSTYHHLTWSVSYIKFSLWTISVPHRKRSFTRSEGFVCFVHCPIDTVQKSPRHIVGTSSIITEWMNAQHSLFVLWIMCGQVLSPARLWIPLWEVQTVHCS